MSQYRYIFLTMRSEAVVAEIPLFGVFMDMELNVGGRFDAAFQLDQTGVSNQTLLDATIPGSTYLVVERDDSPIWAGFVWSRTYQSQAKTVQIFAQSFEQYPEYQLVRSNFTAINQDQRNIFRDLWSTMQSVVGRNININVPAAFSPNIITKTVQAIATDFKFYAEIMSSIANASDGFDWYIDIAKSGVLYNKNLLIGYPSLGALAPTVEFSYPGSILNYYHTESMAAAGTNIFVLGAGEGSGMLFSEVEHTVMINSGFPRWDKVVSRKDINNASLFANLVAQEKKNRKPPMPVTKITVKADRDPVFGSWSLGDNVNVFIQDSRFPSGMTQTARIVKWDLHPQSSDGVEESNIIFQGDEEE